MKQSVGFRYLDYQYKEQMVWGFHTRDDKECYVVNAPNKDDDRVYGNLVPEADMDTLISKQGEFKQGIIRRQERAEAHQLQELAEQEKQREKENLFGFDENLTTMQRGKILKVLMKEFRYDGAVMTRKDFVISRVKIGCEFKQKTFGQAYSKRVEEDTKTTYTCFYPNSNVFVEITKTECDFADYLAEQNVFHETA